MGDRDALLLYDGTCGFCAASVQFVLRHDRARRTLRFASLQSATGERVRNAHPDLNQIDSVIWYEPGAAQNDLVLVRSAAVLHVLAYLGGIWRILGALGRVVPRFIRDAVYDLIARHRHKLIRRDAPTCVLPTPEERARFVDLTPAETAASR